MEPHIDRVRAFYENNTRLFLFLGSGRVTGALHREVWGPGVATLPQATRYVDALVLEAVKDLSETDQPLRLLDAGCGVGSTLCFLAEHLSPAPHSYLGITVSEDQARRATERAAQEGSGSNVRFQVKSYLDLEPAPHYDLIFGIESFVLGPDPAAFFNVIASALRPGGRLLLIDDFLVRPHATFSNDERGYIETFIQGWDAGSLITQVEADQLASEAGLTRRSSYNLTPYLSLDRPRDKWIAGWYRLLKQPLMRWDYSRSLMGGHALQQALKGNVVGYYCITWEKAQ